MKGSLAALFCAVLVANSCYGAESYRSHLVGPAAVARVTAGAIWGQMLNRPHEWGQGAAGFAKRFASGAAEHGVKTTVEFGVATLRHEDLRYHRSGKTGFKPRLEAAVVSTFITRKTDTGQRTFASGRSAGNVTAGLVSRLWQPARLHTIGGGLATAGILTGMDVASNVVQEFWPEIRHPHRKH